VCAAQPRAHVFAQIIKDMLEFNTAFDKDILVIELEGSLDSHSAADFRAWFNEKIAGGYRAFALDCLCLEYVSSAGITSLIELQNLLAGRQGKMVLYQLSSETRQLLKFLQLDSKLTLVSDYDEAISALTGIRKIVKEPVQVPEPDAMVGVGEIRVLSQAEPKAEAAGVKQTPPPANEMHMEEHFSAEKKGLHPIHDELHVSKAQPTPQPAPTATVPSEPAPTQPAGISPEVIEKKAVVETAPAREAHEVKVNMDAKRLITCPNCKSVLRVVVAGEYLCPACRFRFAYKGTAN
jgi:anti-anti-sigma factor